MLSKIIKKLSKRYLQFLKHELVKNSFFSLVRYIFLNITIRIVNEPLIINWYNNIKYYLIRGDSSLISNYYFRIYDYEETAFLLSHLNKEDLFIDIGANQGLYTLTTSCVIGCKTIAIEPVPDTLECESISLDELIDSSIDVNCIKIDVEGFEKMVLEGAERILKSSFLNVIIIELNNSNLYYNYKEDEIVKILEDNSFKSYS